MAHTLSAGGFWLPADFLTDDDILFDKENFNRNKINNNGLSLNKSHHFSFPGEFPYEFDSSPVESLVCSTESESDEDDFLTLIGLTRKFTRSSAVPEAEKITHSRQQFEKPTRVLSGSPQSTLMGGCSGVSSNGSPNGPSPTATPFGRTDDAWNLIYAAAGQVARLKMNAEGPIKGPSYTFPTVKTPNPGLSLSQADHFQQVRTQQGSSIWDQEEWISPQQRSTHNSGRMSGGGRLLDLPQPGAWPPLQAQAQNQHQHSGSGMRAVNLGGSGGSVKREWVGAGLKRECAGTGVFLPRRYGNNPSTTTESRKKSGCSTALIPARVVQVLNKNLDNMTVRSQPHTHHRRFDGGFFNPNHVTPAVADALASRRNALLAQQRRINICPSEAAAMNQEIRLPQEWTY